MRRKILDPMNNQIEVLKVPWYPQQDIEWMCMVNSIKMCLEYMKNTYNNRIIRDIVPNMSIEEIMKITNTRRFTGTVVDSHLIKNLNSNIEGIIFSLDEEVNMNKLGAKVEKGIPSIVIYNCQFLTYGIRGAGHAGVIIGTTENDIIINNPWLGSQYFISHEVFAPAWKGGKMIQNQLVDLPVDERSAEKIAYNWIRSTIGNIPHVGTPVKKGEIWNVPVHVNYPRVFKDITTERPQKLRFMSFKNIGEVKIDAIKGLIVDKPTFYQVQHKISENLTLVQKTVQKALVKVGANYFAELPFPSHMHTPLLDVLSWLLVNDRIDVSVDFEQINEEERKKYQQNIDLLTKYGLVEIEGNIITPGNYLIEIESRGKNYHERLSKALSFFFERGYEEIDSIYQVVGPYLTLSSICYERSFEYGGVLPQEYSEIESVFMETYRTEIKRIKLPRYLVQLEAVNILESKTIGGKISWSANENLFNKMCSETDILEPIAGLIEG